MDNYQNNPQNKKDASRASYNADLNKAKETARKQYNNNPEPQKAASHDQYRTHSETIKEDARKQYKTNPEPKRRAARKQYSAHPEPKKRAARKQYKINPDPKRRTTHKQYRINPEPKRRTTCKQYRINPEPKRKTTRKQYRINPEPKRRTAHKQYRINPEPERRTARKQYSTNLESKKRAARKQYNNHPGINKVAARVRRDLNRDSICAQKRDKYALGEPKLDVKDMYVKEILSHLLADAGARSLVSDSFPKMDINNKINASVKAMCRVAAKNLLNKAAGSLLQAARLVQSMELTDKNDFGDGCHMASTEPFFYDSAYKLVKKEYALPIDTNGRCITAKNV